MSVNYGFIRIAAVIGLAAGLSCGETVAQGPPSANETSTLSIKCKALADEKARELTPKSPDVRILRAWHKSMYDVQNNRCYLDLYVHELDSYRKNPETGQKWNEERRALWDVQTDEQIAYAAIENGWKVGLVFDEKHVMTADESRTWDDANAYIDGIMSGGAR
jgi:hypothetical protein